MAGDRVVGIYGSPRRKGNTAVLTDRVLDVLQGNGIVVDKIYLRDYKISPCLEIYACKKDGMCAIRDDFQGLIERVLDSKAVVFASPVFFYGVSALSKAFIDRCQSLWVKKYMIEKTPFKDRVYTRKGFFICVGATKGKRLFEGILLTVKYFFDVIDTELTHTILLRGLDEEGAIWAYPEHLDYAREVAEGFAKAII